MLSVSGYAGICSVFDCLKIHPLTNVVQPFPLFTHSPRV